MADYEGTGLPLGPHPMAFGAAELAAVRVSRAAELAARPHGAR